MKVDLGRTLDSLKARRQALAGADLELGPLAHVGQLKAREQALSHEVFLHMAIEKAGVKPLSKRELDDAAEWARFRHRALHAIAWGLVGVVPAHLTLIVASIVESDSLVALASLWILLMTLHVLVSKLSWQPHSIREVTEVGDRVFQIARAIVRESNGRCSIAILCLEWEKPRRRARRAPVMLVAKSEGVVVGAKVAQEGVLRHR